MKALSALEARNLVKLLNRADLDRVDYAYIKEQIDKLFVGIAIRGITPHRESRLYRGVIYSDKPHDVRQLGYPPKEIIISYQRCNPPHKPMFYCSPDPAAVFYELNVKEGDRLYLSKWSVIKDFFLLQLAPNADDGQGSHFQDIVLTFFETKFSQPIHDTYSSQYKITSAIAEHMSKGNIDDRKDIEIGGMTYPSVSHPNRSENVAIRHDIAETCLRLDYVEELQIKSVADKVIEYDRKDFCSRFPDDKINWQGKILHWTLPPGSAAKATVEMDGWVLRDLDGNVINPG